MIEAGIASAKRNLDSTAKRFLIELKQACEDGYGDEFEGAQRKGRVQGGSELLFGLVKAILNQAEYGRHGLFFIGAVDLYRELGALNCSKHHQ